MKMLQNRTKLAALAAAPLVGLAFAIIAGAFTQHASAQQPNSNKPFAVGAITTATEHVAFAAQTNPKTGAPSGHVVQELATGTDSGPVMCFQPSGNMATISFYVNSGPDAGNYVTFMVVDNGPPGVGGVSPDMYSDCGNQGSSGNCGTNNCMMEPIVNGNIVVSN
jgi:hypothetical protein